MKAAERYPLSWPAGWKRTESHRRKPASFGTRSESISQAGYRALRELSIYAAMRRLTDELGRLRAKGVILSTNVPLTKDGQPRSDRRAPDDPGAAVYFRIDEKDMVLACDRWTHVADNIAAIAAHIACVRGVDRYGVGTLDQAFAGYNALPPPGQAARRAWWMVLGIEESSRLAVAEMAFKKLAMIHHPDKADGSHEIMAELNGAIDEARKVLS